MSPRVQRCAPISRVCSSRRDVPRTRATIPWLVRGGISIISPLPIDLCSPFVSSVRLHLYRDCDQRLRLWNCNSVRPRRLSVLRNAHFDYIVLIITVHRYCVAFVVFFFCYHDNSWTAARSLMKFCSNMYLDNISKCREFPGHRSKVNVIFSLVDQVYRIVFVERGKIVIHNAVFRLSIAWSVPAIFAIKVSSCPKSSALLMNRCT